MRNLTFSARVIDVFNKFETNYEGMNNLMQDVALGREIFDAETSKTISKKEANDKIYNFSLEVLGITDVKDRKAVRRAFRDNSREWFDIIEDTLDVAVTTGLQETEWFNSLVDYKNIAYGDRQDFYSEEFNVLSVATIGESHHDHILQRLNPGKYYTIPTQRYDVKVGADINKYILGDVDWSALIAAIARAYMLKFQEEIYAAVDGAASQLPVTDGFIGNGALSASTKPQFDRIVTNVEDANPGSTAVIMGTKTALKALTAIVDVEFISDKQKEAKTDTGLIGWYDGNALVVVPNRFKDKTYTAKVFDESKLLIMPTDEQDKFVKFIDEGSTEITEVTEKGEANGRWDDLMSYEVQRRAGQGVIIGRQFGQWTL